MGGRPNGLPPLPGSLRNAVGSQMKLNLLIDPLIRYEAGRSRATATLPEVYCALMADRVDAFPALRPHQRHPWHAFLSQLGALALYRSRLDTPPVEAREWASLLRGLTPEFPNDEPWQLLDDDISLPAFMQPPARARTREREYRTEVSTPDEMDILVTSKNHDVKSSIGTRAGVDDWLFALITLQTMGGYAGLGNYGISRMNGGLGNRPAFSLTPSGGGAGAHLRRDMMALLEHRQTILDDYGMNDYGLALLWTRPWDGSATEALELCQLDPFYIEICRRVRLRRDAAGRLRGIRATSRAARIDARKTRGRTGDPWTPFSLTRDNKPFTLGPGGFTYRRVAELLSYEDWKFPALLQPTLDEQHSQQEMSLVARAVVRGQGATHGYHERSFPIGTGLMASMTSRNGTSELGYLASSRLEQIRKVQGILSHAIQLFLARGEEGDITQDHERMVHPWLDRLEELVDARFLDALQIEIEAEAQDRQLERNRWLINGVDGVVDQARAVLRDAVNTLACPVALRYKAQAEAETLFERRLRWKTGLPFLFEETRATAGQR